MTKINFKLEMVWLDHDNTFFLNCLEKEICTVQVVSFQRVSFFSAKFDM